MMQVKRYVANSFAEALIQAKQELGTEAMIVESKKLRVGGLLGFFRREVTELTVAFDQSTLKKAPPRSYASSSAPAAASVTQPQTAGPKTVQAPAAPPAPAAVPAQSGATPVPAPLPVHNLASLEREIAALRTVVARMADRSGSDAHPPDLQGFSRLVYDGLVGRGADEAAAYEIAQRVWTGGSEGQDTLRQELQRMLGPAAPIQARPGERRVIALVGPTGVGKTTTLAKLAARFTLDQRLQVALITSDTFRIAAIDQIRTYADILGVPVYAVDTPEEVAQAMLDTADKDLVLVDTGGRNHRDTARMQELRDFLFILQPDETHLVFSLTANPKDAMDALDTYISLGVNRLTFTKLDEATCPGLMLNIRLRCNQPVSYITNGQSVPEDILGADGVDFAKVLVGA